MRSLILYIFVAVTVCCTTMLSSCRQSIDGRLIHAEEIMEEYPDSALQILTEMDSLNSEYDRHLHTILLAHAKYKNFLDFGNDSTLRTAAEYFIEKDEARQAAKAFFLLGIHQLESDRLGESVLSLTRGLDIARSKECPMEEGQCARGLFFLYGKILDSSAQLKYATQAYEAFEKGGYQDWMAWSRLDIAAALNNKGDFEKSYSMLKNMKEKSIHISDSLLIEDIELSMGLASFNLGNYQTSIHHYAEAFKANPDILEERDIKNIGIASLELNPDSISNTIRDLLTGTRRIIENSPSFITLANNGKYKQAYYQLVQYKNMQDSVLRVILHNNVSEEIGIYNEAEKRITEVKLRNEHILTIAVMIAIAMIALIIYLFFKAKLKRKDFELGEMITNIESLRQDLQLQLERDTKNHKDPDSTSQEKPYIVQLREKYSEANTICDNLYQSPVKIFTKNDLNDKTQQIIHDFTAPESLDKIVSYVDGISGNLYSCFKNDMRDVSQDNLKLFLYLMVGFSSRSISVLLNQTTGSVYTKKHRLKKYIIDRNPSRKDEYLEIFK